MFRSRDFKRTIGFNSSACVAVIVIVQVSFMGPATAANFGPANPLTPAPPVHESCPIGPAPSIDDLRDAIAPAERAYNYNHKWAQEARDQFDDADTQASHAEQAAKDARQIATWDHMEYRRIYDKLEAARAASRPDNEIVELSNEAVFAGERYRAKDKTASNLEAKAISARRRADNAKDSLETARRAEKDSKAALDAAERRLSNAYRCAKEREAPPQPKPAPVTPPKPATDDKKCPSSGGIAGAVNGIACQDQVSP